MNPPRKRQKVSFACQRCRQRKLGVGWLSALNVSDMQANPRSVINNVLANYVCEPVQRVYHVEVQFLDKRSQCRKLEILSGGAKVTSAVITMRLSCSRSRTSWI